MFELTDEQKAGLRAYTPKDTDAESFCYWIQEVIYEHPVSSVLIPTRRQQALMAAQFEKFGKAIAADPLAAVFVATRVKIGLDLATTAELEALARNHRLKAEGSQPDPLVDGYTEIQKKARHAPGDPSGNEMIRAIAAVLTDCGGEPKGSAFVNLVRLCWQFSGRPLPNSNRTLYSRISRALSESDA